MDTAISQIVAIYRQYQFHQKQRIRNDNAVGAFLRQDFGWRNPDMSLSEPEERRKEARDLIELKNADAKKRAAACIKIGELEAAGKPFEASEDYTKHRSTILGVIKAREPFSDLEEVCRKEMSKLAETLPVWKNWGEGITGFGSKSLACIIGEAAGDLSNYSTVGKLYKRLGLAVIDGRRQGNPPNGTKDEWIAHGYNKYRRSAVFVIGDVMVKCSAGPYRKVYDARKQYLQQRAADRGLTIKPAARIKEKEKNTCISEGHIHRDSQRYMEKAFIKDLWRAWNGHAAEVREAA